MARPLVQTDVSRPTRIYVLITTGPGGRPTDRWSGGEALPSFCPPGFDDGPSGSGGHACTKPVSTSALQVAWLKCTLHLSFP